METLLTEKITDGEPFWIAYPIHVAGYGAQHDRVTFAWGSGPTEDAAVQDARTGGDHAAGE